MVRSDTGGRGRHRGAPRRRRQHPRGSPCDGCTGRVDRRGPLHQRFRARPEPRRHPHGDPGGRREHRWGRGHRRPPAGRHRAERGQREPRRGSQPAREQRHPHPRCRQPVRRRQRRRQLRRRVRRGDEHRWDRRGRPGRRPAVQRHARPVGPHRHRPGGRTRERPARGRCRLGDRCPSSRPGRCTDGRLRHRRTRPVADEPRARRHGDRPPHHARHAPADGRQPRGPARGARSARRGRRHPEPGHGARLGHR